MPNLLSHKRIELLPVQRALSMHKSIDSTKALSPVINVSGRLQTIQSYRSVVETKRFRTINHRPITYFIHPAINIFRVMFYAHVLKEYAHTHTDSTNIKRRLHCQYLLPNKLDQADEHNKLKIFDKARI